VILDSLETALNDLNASANVSPLVFPRFAGMAVGTPFFAPGAVVVAELNNPVHNFGVAQAFVEAEGVLASSAMGWVELTLLWTSCSVSGVDICGFVSSSVFSTTGFGESLGIDLGIAGITGIAGKVAR
jgi:hypothetical protein